MTQTKYLSTNEMLLWCNAVLRFTFKTKGAGDRYALFWKTDCFECLSLHNTVV